MSIKVALRKHLGAQEGIANLVTDSKGVRIFPVALEQGRARPALTYQRLPKSTHDHNLKQASGSSLATFKLVCWGDTYEQADTLADAVRHGMQGFGGVVEGTQIDSVVLADEFDDFEEPQDGSSRGIYAVHLDFKIRYAETIPTFS